MKTIISKVTFLLILSISLLSCAQNTKKETETVKQASEDKVVSLISPVELNAKMGDIQLIDIRTPQEFAEGHLKNASNINFYDNNFAAEMAKLDKTKDVYIYCRSGGRSGKASKQLEKMGFSKVYDLKGGYKNWENNNLEVTK